MGRGSPWTIFLEISVSCQEHVGGGAGAEDDSWANLSNFFFAKIIRRALKFLGL